MENKLQGQARTLCQGPEQAQDDILTECWDGVGEYAAPLEDFQAAIQSAAGAASPPAADWLE